MPTPPTLGTPEQQAELQRYMRELRSFDWNYEYSDDYSVVKRNQERLVHLRLTQLRIDPTGEIWLQFMPKYSRHTPATAKEKANG